MMKYVIAIFAVALASGCQTRQPDVYAGEIGHRNPSRGTTTVYRVSFVLHHNGSGHSIAKSDDRTDVDDFDWKRTTEGILFTFVQDASVRYLLQTNTLFHLGTDGTKERFMVLEKQEMPNQTNGR